MTDQQQQVNFLEEWRTYLEENWQQALPVISAFVTPIIVALIGIAYDYAKTKGMI